MRCLSFYIDEEVFAVDVTLVREFARKLVVTPVLSAPDTVVGIANLKGRVITLLSLSELLGRKESIVKDWAAVTAAAIIFETFSGGANQIGLKVDRPGELIDIDEAAIRKPSLSTGAQESFCIAGIAEVGNALYRIIDIHSIIERLTSNDQGIIESRADEGDNNG
ncbi:MAG: chemotaxis protein CheW [Coriobacteriia bacterium]|nr:chemotaxis protein CheW [Coriobacteriia bacterium]